MKKKYSRFRELWAVPKYKTLFKLGGYIFLFIIFFASASLGSKTPTERKDVPSTSYSSMKKNLLEENYSVKYNISSINNYYLEGTIVNDIFNGTLEFDESIIKIKIDQENIYVLSKGEENLETSLLNDINLIYLFPKNIINIVNENSSLMRQSADEKIYSYTIDNKAYSIYVNEDEINKIIILDNIITYDLEYSIIK